jgi:tRNA A-37 threonylcarbamoyl transferase component Bud32
MPNPPKLCPNCKAPIPPDAPGGLCPACVLLGAAGPTQSMPGALASAPTIEELTAAFPDLEVVEMIGHGGMGVIFKARQPRLDRFVALKILPPHLAQQPGFTERFTREARALARLNHPNIVAVYDFGERGSFCFLLMEFVNGVNLRQAMRSGVTPEQALGLVPRICEALQFAHDRGVLHRDIKPENILLDTTGTPKLADFGIAKLAEEGATERHLTVSGAALGTAAYMAPEQIERPGAVDHRADIYSLGVVLYEMLTGELPLGRFAAPSAKAKVTTGVDEVVFRALEKERDRRQQSATEMKTQVEHASDPATGARAYTGGAQRAPLTSEPSISGGPSRVFLLLAIVTALLIPLAGANRAFGSLISPVTLSYLVAVFGALFALWPVVFPSAAAQVALAQRPPRSVLRIAIIFALLSLPLAIVVVLFVMPAVYARGLSPWLGVAIGILIPVLAGAYVALIAGVARAIVRAGAPGWIAFCVAALVAVLTPIAILFTSAIPYWSAGRQRPRTGYEASPTMSVVKQGKIPAVGKWSQGSVELVAITRHRVKDAPWWRMDGGPALEGPFINTGGHVHQGRGESAYDFYFRTRNLAPGASSPTWMIQHSKSSAYGGISALAATPEKPLGDFHVIASTLPADLTNTNIKAGLAYEPWHTLSTSHPGNSIGTQATHEGVSWNIVHGVAFETKDGELVATFTHSRLADWEARLVAVNTEDVEVPTTRVSRLNEQSEWHFPNLPLKSVKELRFQVRPIRWVEFKDVALIPNSSNEPAD